MATVHFGRLLGEAGFSRTVAIKRIHPKHLGSGSMVAALIDEARIASRIQHPNVVPTLDVFADKGELFVVMEFVMGETLARLSAMALESVDAGSELARVVPVSIVGSVGVGMLQGLHAAHEAKNERGQRLGIVHRDISPQNVLVGMDGMVRVLDFGIAKAEERMTSTLSGQIKGKPKYMAPEQIRGETVSRRTDVFATGIVLWEMLAGRRMFRTDMEVVHAFAERRLPEPASRHNPSVTAKLDAVLRRAMAFDALDRFEDAASFAVAIEEAVDVASQRRVSEWLKQIAGAALEDRARKILAIESDASEGPSSFVAEEATSTDLFGSRAHQTSDTDAEPLQGDTTRVGPAPDDLTVQAPSPFALTATPSDPERATEHAVQHAIAMPVPGAKRRGLALAALAALVAGAGVAGLVLTGERSQPLAATSTESLASGAPSTPAAQTAPTSTAIQPVTQNSDVPPAQSSVLSSATTTSTTTNRVIPTGPKPTTTDGSRTAQPRGPDCAVPYVLDQNGVRRFRPECL